MKRLLITLGEPAGIGADIILQALAQDWPVDCTVVGDPQVLENRAKQLGFVPVESNAHLSRSRNL